VTPGQETLTDPSNWQLLLTGAEPAERAEAWLALQAAMLGASRAVLVMRHGADQRLAPLASFPRGNPPGPLLTEAVERCVAQSAAVCVDAGSGGRTAIAHPVMDAAQLQGATAFEMTLASETEQALRLRSLQWGLAMLDSAVLRRNAGADARTGSGFLSMALGRLLAERALVDAARAVVTDLAVWLGCDRVSLGEARGAAATLLAISHMTRFDRRLALPQALESALGEAVGEARMLRYPEDGQGGAVAELARAHGAAAVLSVPFGGMGATDATNRRWAVCLERQRPLDEAERAALEAGLPALGMALQAKADAEQSAAARAWNTLRLAWKRLAGPGETEFKVGAGVLVLVAAFLAFATGTYRVTGNATLEGEVRRVLAAPLDGYVATASARAGDLVKAGATVAALDDRELKLERAKWSGQQAQYLRQLQEATAKHERAQANILQAQLQQAQAQIHLLDEQVGRSNIVAPFDGLIVSGDLSQTIGGAVRKGQVLFEIAPLAGYRVVIQVDEGDIEGVDKGQTGTLVLASLPERGLPIRVSQVTPVTRVAEGRNQFRVEAVLEAATDRLRPGMEGIGKIEVGERNLAWIWTRPFVNWVRLTWWRYIP
jgi:RND family efflux transporter MFP subunit